MYTILKPVKFVVMAYGCHGKLNTFLLLPRSICTIMPPLCGEIPGAEAVVAFQ